jgi:hypothetical protein
MSATNRHSPQRAVPRDLLTGAPLAPDAIVRAVPDWYNAHETERTRQRRRTARQLWREARTQARSGGPASAAERAQRALEALTQVAGVASGPHTEYAPDKTTICDDVEDDADL